MTTINPYLTFKGNCEEAFTFYKTVFKKEFGFLGRYKDVPESERGSFTKESDNMIMHVSLPISAETELAGCDVQEAFGQEIVTGNSFTLSISTDSKTEADRLFQELSSGGNVKMPMADTFWGSYFGMLTDRFGINWMISAQL